MSQEYGPEFGDDVSEIETTKIREVLFCAEQLEKTYSNCYHELENPGPFTSSKSEMFKRCVKVRLNQLVTSMQEDGLAGILFKFPLKVGEEEGVRDFYFLPEKDEFFIGRKKFLRIQRERPGTDEEFFDHIPSIAKKLIKTVMGFDSLSELRACYGIKS